MPDYRRMPRTLAAYLLAVPVIALVYVGAFGSRVWAALRPAAATFLGATVIGTVYADEALKRAPQTPLRAAAVLALAVVLVAPGMAPAPALAANDPAENVIAAAREYLGRRFQLGAEGPKTFDCSGLVFRAFSDAGELPRIGGMRLRAVGYMRWFVSRGLFTKDEDKGRRGDLVVWNMGEHIGIYLGDGKAISALINPWGVTVHSLHGIRQRVSYFLHVDWSNGDGPPDPGPGDDPEPTDNTNPADNAGSGDEPGSAPDSATGEEAGPADPGTGEEPTGEEPGSGETTDPGTDQGSADDQGPVDQPPADPGAGPGNGDRVGSAADNSTPPADTTDNTGTNLGPESVTAPADQPVVGRGTLATSTGTLNMRIAADPTARIIGWVSRGDTFRVLAGGRSPAGHLWYQIQTSSGKQGWIYSYWVREL